MVRQALIPAPMDAAEYGAHIVAELQNMQKLVREAQIKFE